MPRFRGLMKIQPRFARTHETIMQDQPLRLKRIHRTWATVRRFHRSNSSSSATISTASSAFA